MRGDWDSKEVQVAERSQALGKGIEPELEHGVRNYVLPLLGLVHPGLGVLRRRVDPAQDAQPGGAGEGERINTRAAWDELRREVGAPGVDTGVRCGV